MDGTQATTEITGRVYGWISIIMIRKGILEMKPRRNGSATEEGIGIVGSTYMHPPSPLLAPCLLGLAL
jgi:hypothetical protein